MTPADALLAVACGALGAAAAWLLLRLAATYRVHRRIRRRLRALRGGRRA